MGLIVLIVWLGSLAVLGTPGLLLSILVCVKAKAQRTAAFWLIAAAAALVSVVGQYVMVFIPFVRRGLYSFDLLFAASIGWQLLAPALGAVVFWLVGRSRGYSAVLALAAGLFASIPLGIALALPVFFTVPSLLGLQVEH